MLTTAQVDHFATFGFTVPACREPRAAAPVLLPGHRIGAPAPPEHRPLTSHHDHLPGPASPAGQHLQHAARDRTGPGQERDRSRGDRASRKGSRATGSAAGSLGQLAGGGDEPGVVVDAGQQLALAPVGQVVLAGAVRGRRGTGGARSPVSWASGR